MKVRDAKFDDTNVLFCFFSTVRPLLSEHHWDLPKCPLNRGL